jgi:hypothetical protein
MHTAFAPPAQSPLLLLLLLLLLLSRQRCQRLTAVLCNTSTGQQQPQTWGSAYSKAAM